MELISIEETRIAHLVGFYRPAGQIYLPELATKIIQRYSFSKAPTLDELTTAGRDHVAFGIGKFGETQISEFRVYNDGIIVESRSNSKIVDAFVDDLLGWAEKEFGLTRTSVPETERYYESTLVIRASTDLTTVLKWPPEILQSFNEFASKLPRKSNAFQHSGFLLDIDVTKEGPRRRPSRFALDRRAGMPFEKNIFFSQSPFPTDDHIAFLEAIERLASR